MCCYHVQSKLFLLSTTQSCRHSLGCICMPTLALSPAFWYCVLLLFWSLPGAIHKEEVPKHPCSSVKSSVVASLVLEPFFFSHLFLEDIFWISRMVVVLLGIYLLPLSLFFSHPFSRKNPEDLLSQHKKYASAVGKQFQGWDQGMHLFV